MSHSRGTVAVVLFNLGGPDSKAAIRPFLFNFFTDKNIIRLPLPFRYMLAALIAHRRSQREAGDSYGFLGDRSPLRENTERQAQALEAVLNAQAENEGPLYRVFVCMRYWHPMAPEVVKAVKDAGATRVVLLPLYPQFSKTTTRSSLQTWNKAARRAGLSLPTRMICCYPFDDGFVHASAALVTQAYRDAQAALAGRDLPPIRILFSAHGLPESVITDGDPYQWQCEQSAARIVEALDLPGPLDWEICYQSRVGPKKWIGPSTEDALKKAAAEGVPVIIYPHAFVNEHVETLVEIEIEYRHMAEEAGIAYFGRVPTVDVHQAFINGLGRAVMAAQDDNRPAIAPPEGKRLCPADYRRCCMAEGVVVKEKKAASGCCSGKRKASQAA